jgi:tetratricopeptide (TPR) repeat protein
VGCPAEEQLLSYAAGRRVSADGLDRHEVEAHLDVCTSCAELVVELARGSGDVAELVVPAASPVENLLLPPGALVGRYVIGNVLGIGGMGVVYAANDPELGRDTALKLLRRERFPGPDGIATLLAEARALAQLSHPNVITVFDVGSVGERDARQLFIAMELVRGVTLRRWLERKPTGREIVKAFTRAGRGLAAAHDAGLVHRDFKPDNVLVGDDGRVVVSDFGLARAIIAPSGVGMQGAVLTTTPAGTPAYMAPEVRAGGSSDARADQYSFCVALGEALWGERPSWDRAPPRRGRLKEPAWLRSCILRGLRRDPAERFASMNLLVAQLQRDRSRTRRWVGAGMLAAGCAVAAAVGTHERERSEPCSNLTDRMQTVWTAQRVARLSTKFTGSTHGYIQDTWIRAKPLLEGYANALSAMERASCEATRVRGEQSEHLLDLRTACLDQRWNELDALAAQLEAGDDGTLGKAVSAASALVPVEQCANTTALLDTVPPPPTERRPKVDAAWRGLATAKALGDTGNYKAGAKVALDQVQVARALGYAPLLAEALFRAGELFYGDGDRAASEPLLTEAVDAADAAHNDSLRVLASVRLIPLFGHSGRLELVEANAAHAKAALDRLGAPIELSVEYLNALGRARYEDGKYADAEQLWTRALATIVDRSKALPELHARVLANLGMIESMLDRTTRAAELQQESIAIYEQLYGPRHPKIGQLLDEMGLTLLYQGKCSDAVDVDRRAVAILTDAFDDGNPHLVFALTNLGQAVACSGQHTEALALYRKATAMADANVANPDWLSAAHAHGLVGDALLELRQLAEAEQEYKRALDLSARSKTPDPDTFYYSSGLGAVRRAQGRYREALSFHQQACEVAEKESGNQDSRFAGCLRERAEDRDAAGDLAAALTDFRAALAIDERLADSNPVMLAAGDLNGVGQVLTKLHRFDEACAVFERALGILHDSSLSPGARARLQFEYAKAMAGAGRDSKQVRALAQQARTTLEQLGDVASVADIDAWLRGATKR